MGNLNPEHGFVRRHIGPDAKEQGEMLALLGFKSLDALTQAVVPADIQLQKTPAWSEALSEQEALACLHNMAGRNKLYRSLIGMGYYGTFTPPVIQRNILENPGWYTAYTPYQPEISQGRLEALLNFQTMVCDLTGMEIANASLLDEATAAAEAMTVLHAVRRNADAQTFLVSSGCHPQTIAVLKTRASALGIPLEIADPQKTPPHKGLFGALLQYPDTDGVLVNPEPWIEAAHKLDVLVAVATDLLALALIRPPGEMGADVVVGSAQRFGVPMGYGGPHAAFFATRDEFKRQMPGRLVGVSKDADGNQAYRLTLQTREQHIRRDKATSNICTAQVLLAVMASMYAVYHGPDGLRGIARRIHALACGMAVQLRKAGYTVAEPFFDTLHFSGGKRDAASIRQASERQQCNLRWNDDGSIGISLDETMTREDAAALLEIFIDEKCESVDLEFEDHFGELQRTSPILSHPIFNRHHSETEMLRYIRFLEGKDLTLTHSMIPLGSCTMKLNATSEMLPVSWRAFSELHPFVPEEQAAGYAELVADLEHWIADMTGFAAVSLQPNAGSQGEYAGLLAIRGYHQSRGEGHRTVCLIPTSAHGTNPASAVMAGMTVVTISCDAQGNVSLDDLRAKAAQHREHLAALMVTYPSTHGVFETGIREICQIVHQEGGQVYMDGANFNAQVGLCRPGDFGADVCHLNLHKTFCIPHGGGGPGMGPIAAAKHLAPFLPGHPLKADRESGSVSGAPFGSASILVISWMYIRMMGWNGLREASQVAILNANYIAKRLQSSFPVLFTGAGGLVAHEAVLDLRGFKSAGVEVEDVCKRLMDYGFHAPTMSWPVPGTLMVEPTESEDKAELDRFCDAMTAIHSEIQEIAQGQADKLNNPLKHAPHTAFQVCDENWNRAYSRQKAAFPAPWLKQNKFWPPVARIDNVYGDRNVFCSCPPLS